MTWPRININYNESDTGIRLLVHRVGTNVVFDFGLWGKDERSALRWIADTLGVRAQVARGV